MVARPKSPLTTPLHSHITTLTYVDVIYLSEHRVALGQVAVGARPHGAQNTLPDALPQGRYFVGGVVQLLGELLQRTLPKRVRYQPVPTKPENRANVLVYKQKLPIIGEPHFGFKCHKLSQPPCPKISTDVQPKQVEGNNILKD